MGAPEVARLLLSESGHGYGSIGTKSVTDLLTNG
jgi:hypothetical protein